MKPRIKLWRRIIKNWTISVCTLKLAGLGRLVNGRSIPTYHEVQEVNSRYVNGMTWFYDLDQQSNFIRFIRFTVILRGKFWWVHNDKEQARLRHYSRINFELVMFIFILVSIEWQSLVVLIWFYLYKFVVLIVIWEWISKTSSYWVMKLVWRSVRTTFARRAVTIR